MDNKVEEKKKKKKLINMFAFQFASHKFAFLIRKFRFVFFTFLLFYFFKNKPTFFFITKKKVQNEYPHKVNYKVFKISEFCFGSCFD